MNAVWCATPKRTNHLVSHLNPRTTELAVSYFHGMEDKKGRNGGNGKVPHYSKRLFGVRLAIMVDNTACVAPPYPHATRIAAVRRSLTTRVSVGHCIARARRRCVLRNQRRRGIGNTPPAVARAALVQDAARRPCPALARHASTQTSPQTPTGRGSTRESVQTERVHTVHSATQAEASQCHSQRLLLARYRQVAVKGRDIILFE